MPPSPDGSDGAGHSESPTSQQPSSEEGGGRTQDGAADVNQEVEDEEEDENVDEEVECRKRLKGGDDSELSLKSDSSSCCDDITQALEGTSDPEQRVDAGEDAPLGEGDVGEGGASDWEEKKRASNLEEVQGGGSQEVYRRSVLKEEEEEEGEEEKKEEEEEEQDGEAEEEQLCELVLRLKTSLSLPTHAVGSQKRDVLLAAAQGVGDSVSNLVSMVNFCPEEPLQSQPLDHKERILG